MAAPAVENRAAPATSSRRLRSDGLNPYLPVAGEVSGISVTCV